MFVSKHYSMLETKAILTGIFYAFGIPVTVLGILENFGTWKADILFVLAGLLLVARICYYIVEKDQNRRKRDMELEEQRMNLNNKKSNHGDKNKLEK